MLSEKQSQLEKLESRFGELTTAYHTSVVQQKSFSEVSDLAEEICQLLNQIAALKFELTNASGES